MSNHVVNHENEEPTSAKSVAELARIWVSRWAMVVRARSLGMDLMAGLTTAAVALPLNIALAVASGVPASAGLVAGALGGFLAACFGGSSLQVSGPAAALSTLVLAIAGRFGAVGVAAASIIVGITVFTLGLLRMGRFAKYVPHSVLAGFTTGVGLKLLNQQIPEALGFDYSVLDIGQMMHRPLWLHDVSWLAVVCACFVAIVVLATKSMKRFPAAIIGISLVTTISIYLNWDLPRVATVPDSIPDFIVPRVKDEEWLELVWMTLPLAILVAVESLLSARAVDAQRPDVKKVEPNLELMGMGIANTATGLFGGMPVSGVIVRSSVNAQAGGRTRLSAMFHAIALGVAVLAAAEWLAQIPIPALAGLLVLTGARLLDFAELKHLLKSDLVEAMAFVAAAAGTVSGNLMAGLVAGLVISFVNQWAKRKALLAQTDIPRVTKSRSREEAERGIRAVLGSERATSRKPQTQLAPGHHTWLRHITQEAVIAPSAFVHEAATVIGHVVLSDHVHVAADTSVRADEGSPFFIGPNTNIQDGVILHALKDKRVRVGDEEWAIFIGRNVSLAHGALVHGPCYIGDDTFVGFKAVVHDSVVGSHCFVGIGAVVVGVEVPDNRFVPHGTIVSTQAAADALPEVAHAQLEFNEDVVDVNRGLASAYHSAESRLRAAVDRARDGALLSRPGAIWDANWGKPSAVDLNDRF
ncbi:MAG: hypothetical protein HOW73_41995 [Polyangiaceae bacterium]|nr:hypothetical protein [Polyangiaceae bacterium]